MASGRTYSQETMQTALNEIRNKGMRVREASRTFGVPKTTLLARLKGKIKEGPIRMGPTPYLTAIEESKIVDWCIKLANCGFPRKEDDILNTVQKMIKDDMRKTPFKDDRPGRTWYNAFLKRNPRLAQRTPEALSKGRAIVTEEFIKKWFQDLEEYLNSIDCSDILQDPQRIFNGDETGFCLCPKTGKVLAQKGCKNVYTVNMGNDKEMLTVLLVFTAAGHTLPPLIIFPYIRTPKAVLDSMPAEWFLGKTESGWMRCETFNNYIEKGVHKWIEENNIKKPVILFVDGHRSHMSLDLSEFCSKNEIILYALPPNTTHIMQPADVSVFKPLKNEWRNTVREWQSRPENDQCPVTKHNFCKVFKMVLDKAELNESIKNGFRRCGLYPFDPEAVDYSKCIQNVRENFVSSSKTFSNELVKGTLYMINELQGELSAKGVNVQDVIDVISSAKTTSSQEQLLEEINQPPSHTDPAANSTAVEEIIFTVNEDGTLTKNTAMTYNFEDDFMLPSRYDTAAILDDVTEVDNSSPCPTLDNFTIDMIDILKEQTENTNVVDVELPQTPIASKRNNMYCSPHLQPLLQIPKPFKKKNNTPTTTLSSAISSPAWRTAVQEKEEKKASKALEVEMRKEERALKKANKENSKNKKIKNKKKSKCFECKEHLVSDAEENDEKNVGCDLCAKWFHLKCTTMNGLPYEEASKMDFFCNYCGL